VARYGGLRQQPNGSRPRAAEAAPATDAWPQSDYQARIVIAGHAFIQNTRRGHYELGVEKAASLRVAAAFDELALAI